MINKPCPKLAVFKTKRKGVFIRVCEDHMEMMKQTNVSAGTPEPVIKIASAMRCEI